MTAVQSMDEQAALGRFDFSSLLSGAAHLRPDERAIDDAGAPSSALTFAEMDRRATALAQAWRELGLRPGERILIAAGASVTASIAILAAARAGLDALLAPLHLAAPDVAAFARSAKAVALAGVPTVGDLAPIDALFAIAAELPDVRLVCSLGAAIIDGAVSLDPASLPMGAAAFVASGATAAVLTLDEEGHIGIHSQQTLIAAALDLAARARIGSSTPILTTFAPMSFIGLASGPLLGLLTGARLICSGLFDSHAFLAAIENAQPVHLIVPAAASEMLTEAGVIDRDRIAALIAVTRFNIDDRNVEKRAPQLVAGPRLPRIVDLYACDECAAIAEPRGAEAIAQPPAGVEHLIHLDDRAILAVRRAERGGGFIGSAVSAKCETMA